MHIRTDMRMITICNNKRIRDREYIYVSREEVPCRQSLIFDNLIIYMQKVPVDSGWIKRNYNELSSVI